MNNEPWLSNVGMVGGILGTAIGILGAIVGTLAGAFIPKGKAKKLVLGIVIFAIVLSLILLVVGIVAYLSGQPRDVWYCFGYPGLLSTIIFSPFFFIFRHEYRKAELRKSMSEDLTFGGKKDDK